MRVKFQKWGNSPAVRLPAKAIRDLGARYGDELELEIRQLACPTRAGWAEALARQRHDPSSIPDILDDDALEDWAW